MDNLSETSTCNFKTPWYFSTPLICILCAAWFLYGIPLLIGIILAILKSRNEKKLAAYSQDLSQKYADVQSLLTPEMQDAHKLQLLVNSLHEEEASANKNLAEIQRAIEQKQYDLENIEKQISEKKKELICVDEEVLVQEFGLYTPQYDFASALDYKEELAKIRQTQKDLIRDKKAVLGSTDWTVNDSKAKGRKMVSDTQKLLLRAFNNECDDLIDRVKYTNFDATLDRIYKSAETISKLGSIMKISISQSYLNAKVKELRLAFEYRQKKQEEKEEQKAARAEQREQARLQKEIELHLKNYSYKLNRILIMPIY